MIGHLPQHQCQCQPGPLGAVCLPPARPSMHHGASQLMRMWLCVCVCVCVFSKILFIYFLERGEGREKEKEKTINLWQVASWVPLTRGSSLQCRHVPRLGIELATPQFTVWCSIHWAMPARAWLWFHRRLYGPSKQQPPELLMCKFSETFILIRILQTTWRGWSLPLFHSAAANVSITHLLV